MCKKRNSRFIVVMTAFMSLATRSGLAGVTNGDFAYGLDHWTIEAGTIEHSIDDEAIFAPDPDEALSSTLSQVFTLDTGALTLCFDVRMETESEDGTPETDVFTASLSGTTFYTLSSSDVSGGSFEQTVSYDVSNWAGEEVELRFSLEHDYADHRYIRVPG